MIYRNWCGLFEDDLMIVNVIYFFEYNVFFKDFYFSKISKVCFFVRWSLFFMIVCVIGIKDC